MDGELKIVEGTIPFKGYETWYMKVGECAPGKLPLLTLHGGPGAKHNYLRSLDELATKYGRQVIYYDQLGCGHSPTPYLPDLWSDKLWEEEIDVVRDALGLDELHLLGQSWGGMLAMQYAINRQPVGVHSMVVASSPASIPLWEEEANRLMEWLPEGMEEVLTEAIKTGEYDTPEYEAASKEYYLRHVCNLLDPPAYVSESMDNMEDVYHVMQGNDEFMVTGKLKGWDITADLDKIKVPTLLTSGVTDEATPWIVKPIYDAIPGARWELLMGTHLVHVEQQEQYNQIVEAFFAEHE